jgi:hypothetical protein
MNINSIAAQTFDKVYFRPALYYQVIEDYHCADGGLEFRMNFKTKQNEGKFPSDVQLSGKSLEKCKREQLKLVPESAARPDAANLGQRLLNATTWNQPDVLEKLIRTCYVPNSLVIPCLTESAKRNYVEIVSVLLKAGANPSAIETTCGKNALQISCETGQEDVARLLIDSMMSKSDIYAKTSNGLNCFELAKNNDLGFMARRLEKLVKEKFVKSTSTSGEVKTDMEIKKIDKKATTITARNGTESDCPFIYNLVNQSYKIEIGNTGIAFKNTDRFLSQENVFLTGPPESYIILNDENNVMVGCSCVRLVSNNDNKNVLFVLDHDLCFDCVSTNEDENITEEAHKQMREAVAKKCDFDLTKYDDDGNRFISKYHDLDHDFVILSQNNEHNIRTGWKVANSPVEYVSKVLSVHDINLQRKTAGASVYDKNEAKSLILKDFMKEHNYHFAVFIDDSEKECKAMKESDLNCEEFDTNDSRLQVKTFHCPRPTRGSKELPGLFNYPKVIENVSTFVDSMSEMLDNNTNKNQEKVKKIGTFGPFAVLQDRQNMGIGTKLLNEIEKKCSLNGVSEIVIEVVNHRTDLFKFYEKRGYVQSGETRPFEDVLNHCNPGNSVLTRKSHYILFRKKI